MKDKNNRDSLWIHEYNMERILLNTVFPDNDFVHNRVVRNCVLRTRPDFRSDELMLIFEYDGPRHYTESRTIVYDRIKRNEYKKMGYKVIEWPYYIQPSRSSLKEILGMDVEFEQLYPHGFNEEGVITPADFCSLGIERFKRELEIFKGELEEIRSSLKNKMNRGMDPDLLVPIDMRYLLD